MENWEVMAQAIPRGGLEQVAAAMRKRGYKCSYDLVTRWLRPQTSDEQPEATGQASPVDKTCDLIDVLLDEFGKDSARLLVNQVNAHFHRRAFPDSNTLSICNSPGDLTQTAGQLIREAGQSVESLLVQGITRETLYSLIQLRTLVDEVLACANQDLLRAESSSTSTTEPTSKGVSNA